MIIQPTMKTKVLNNKKEIAISLTACLVIASTNIISLFNGIIRSYITLPYKLDTIFIFGVFSLIVLFSLKTILKRSTPSLYVIISFFLISYLIMFLLNSYYDQLFMEIGYKFILLSAPWIFVTYAVRDYRLLKKWLFISAIIILISVIANVFIFKYDIFNQDSYNQLYTYMLLSVAIIAATNIFEKIRIKSILLFLISVILLFSMGGRGPLLSLVLFLLLKVLLIFKEKLKRLILFISFMLIIVITTYLLFDEITYCLISLLQNMNLSTRTIDGLLQGKIFIDDARVLLFKYSADLIVEHPITGIGIGKDRIILGNMIGFTDKSELVGWYPHNIFIEILLHFGIFIGGALIIFLSKLNYTVLFMNKDKDAIDVICIFIGLGLFPLLVSRSYITCPEFFALLGFCLYQYKCVKMSKRVNQFVAIRETGGA